MTNVCDAQKIKLSKNNNNFYTTGTCSYLKFDLMSIQNKEQHDHCSSASGNSVLDKFLPAGGLGI